MVSRFEEAAYNASQSARVAWFMSHFFAARKMSGPLTREGEAPFKSDKPVPSRDEIAAGLRELFARDLENAKAGLYDLPHTGLPKLSRALRSSRRFFGDVPEHDRRRSEKSHSEINVREAQNFYPPYYLQNFHYQTDGWFSEESAKLYDFQVEVLFGGSADAMRRQALVPLAEILKGQDQHEVKLLDVACGTGSFLRVIKDNYPRLPVTGLDLSPDYLAEARRRLNRWWDVDFAHANAETIPFDDNNFDVLTNLYLFHELPPKVRPIVAKEMVRVLKPGGRLIFIDSLQYGDTDGWDGLLEYFPEGFHEPYYSSYLSEDLEALFNEAGAELISSTSAFLSTVTVFQKA